MLANDQTEIVPQLITREDASKRLSVGLRTLDRYLDSGEIPFLRIGRTVRIKASDLVHFLEVRQAPTSVANPKSES